jgi:hypothetical protein
MRSTAFVVGLLALALVVQRANAERPLEKKESATNVVTGVIKQIDTKESKFGADGVQTNYTAEIAVAKVEKGEGIKAGDTIKINWFHVTKRPSKLLPGAYGHGYAVAKKGETVRVYLMKRNSGYEVIYNSEGMEAVKK